MKKITPLIFILISAGIFAQSEGLDERYDVGRFAFPVEIIQSTSGDYLLTGGYNNQDSISNIFLMKVDPYGDSLWLRRYYDSESKLAISLTENNENDLFIAGWVDSNAYLMKTDQNGVCLWDRTRIRYDDNIYFYRDIQSLDNGDVVITGTNRPPFPTWPFGIYDRYTSNGDSVFQISTHVHTGYGMLLSGSNHVIIYGQIAYTGSSIPHVSKYSIDGELVWNKEIDNDLTMSNHFMIQLPTSEYIFSGWSYSNFTNIRSIVKIDTLGEVIISNDYIIKGDPWMPFCYMGEGRLIAVGYDYHNSFLFQFNDKCDSMGIYYLTDDTTQWGTTIIPYNESSVLVAGQIGTEEIFIKTFNIDSLFMGEQEWSQVQYFEIKTFPNPFAATSTFSYSLAKPSTITISIFNPQGQIIEKIEQEQAKGEQQVRWDAEGLPAGMYYFRIQAGDKVGSGKMVKME